MHEIYEILRQLAELINQLTTLLDEIEYIAVKRKK